MLIPPTKAMPNHLPRTMTFIVDSSGSMGGESMRQAKRGLEKALKTLTSQDRFNIIDFDSGAVSLYHSPQFYDSDTQRDALRFIDRLEADGGTNIDAALNLAFNQIDNDIQREQSLQQIVFLTDGSVGNEAALMRLINQRLGDARLFTVGIGSAPNRHFMQKAAQFGRGSYTFIGNIDEVSEKMGALLRKIQSPALTNIQVNWQNFGTNIGTVEASQHIEMYPERVPDIYVGEPMMLVAKSDMPMTDVVVTGRVLGSQWSQKLALSPSALVENVDSLWARRKIANIMDTRRLGMIGEDKAKSLVTELSLAHHVMSKYTSFVAIEEVISRPENAKSRNQSVKNLMPSGSTMSIPQTATNRTLLMLLGLVGLLGLILSKAVTMIRGDDGKAL